IFGFEYNDNEDVGFDIVVDEDEYDGIEQLTFNGFKQEVKVPSERTEEEITLIKTAQGKIKVQLNIRRERGQKGLYSVEDEKWEREEKEKEEHLRIQNEAKLKLKQLLIIQKQRRVWTRVKIVRIILALRSLIVVAQNCPSTQNANSIGSIGAQLVPYSSSSSQQSSYSSSSPSLSSFTLSSLTLSQSISSFSPVLRFILPLIIKCITIPYFYFDSSFLLKVIVNKVIEPQSLVPHLSKLLPRVIEQIIVYENQTENENVNVNINTKDERRVGKSEYEVNDDEEEKSKQQQLKQKEEKEKLSNQLLEQQNNELKGDGNEVINQEQQDLKDQEEEEEKEKQRKKREPLQLLIMRIFLALEDKRNQNVQQFGSSSSYDSQIHQTKFITLSPAAFNLLFPVIKFLLEKKSQTPSQFLPLQLPAFQILRQHCSLPPSSLLPRAEMLNLLLQLIPYADVSKMNNDNEYDDEGNSYNEREGQLSLDMKQDGYLQQINNSFINSQGKPFIFSMPTQEQIQKKKEKEKKKKHSELGEEDGQNKNNTPLTSQQQLLQQTQQTNDQYRIWKEFEISQILDCASTLVQSSQKYSDIEPILFHHIVSKHAIVRASSLLVLQYALNPILSTDEYNNGNDIMSLLLDYISESEGAKKQLKEKDKQKQKEKEKLKEKEKQQEKEIKAETQIVKQNNIGWQFWGNPQSNGAVPGQESKNVVEHLNKIQKIMNQKINNNNNKLLLVYHVQLISMLWFARHDEQGIKELGYINKMIKQQQDEEQMNDESDEEEQEQEDQQQSSLFVEEMWEKVASAGWEGIEKKRERISEKEPSPSYCIIHVFPLLSLLGSHSGEIRRISSQAISSTVIQHNFVTQQLLDSREEKKKEEKEKLKKEKEKEKENEGKDAELENKENKQQQFDEEESYHFLSLQVIPLHWLIDIINLLLQQINPKEKKPSSLTLFFSGLSKQLKQTIDITQFNSPFITEIAKSLRSGQTSPFNATPITSILQILSLFPIDDERQGNKTTQENRYTGSEGYEDNQIQNWNWNVNGKLAELRAGLALSLSSLSPLFPAPISQSIQFGDVVGTVLKGQMVSFGDKQFQSTLSPSTSFSSSSLLQQQQQQSLQQYQYSALQQQKGKILSVLELEFLILIGVSDDNKESMKSFVDAAINICEEQVYREKQERDEVREMDKKRELKEKEKIKVIDDIFGTGNEDEEELKNELNKEEKKEQIDKKEEKDSIILPLKLPQLFYQSTLAEQQIFSFLKLCFDECLKIPSEIVQYNTSVAISRVLSQHYAYHKRIVQYRIPLMMSVLLGKKGSEKKGIKDDKKNVSEKEKGKKKDDSGQQYKRDKTTYGLRKGAAYGIAGIVGAVWKEEEIEVIEDDKDKSKDEKENEKKLKDEEKKKKKEEKEKKREEKERIKEEKRKQKEELKIKKKKEEELKKKDKKKKEKDEEDEDDDEEEDSDDSDDDESESESEDDDESDEDEDEEVEEEQKITEQTKDISDQTNQQQKQQIIKKRFRMKGGMNWFVRQSKVFNTILTAASEKVSTITAREGAMIQFEVLFIRFKSKIEPLFDQILPHMLSALAETALAVRSAASDATYAMMKNMSAFGVRYVLPSLLYTLLPRKADIIQTSKLQQYQSPSLTSPSNSNQLVMQTTPQSQSSQQSSSLIQQQQQFDKAIQIIGLEGIGTEWLKKKIALQFIQEEKQREEQREKDRIELEKEERGEGKKKDKDKGRGWRKNRKQQLQAQYDESFGQSNQYSKNQYESHWRSKVGAIGMLGKMAQMSAEQLGQAMSAVVPTLTKVLADPHPHIQSAAKQALWDIGAVVECKEIKSRMQEIIDALCDVTKTETILQMLLGEKDKKDIEDEETERLLKSRREMLMSGEEGINKENEQEGEREDKDNQKKNNEDGNEVEKLTEEDGNKDKQEDVSKLKKLSEDKQLLVLDPSSFALVFPIILRGLRSRLANTRVKALRATGNLSMMVPSRELSPYMSDLIPYLKQALLDTAQYRECASQALAVLVQGLGEQSLLGIVDWMLKVLWSGGSEGNITSDKDQIGKGGGLVGVASGLASVIGVQGLPRLRSILNSLLSGLTSDNKYVREGFLHCFQFLPGSMKEDFEGVIGDVLWRVLRCTGDQESEQCRETAMSAV
ncbi:MAG: putative Translational activator HuGCN1, partial [Streblomastix strix]